MHKIIQNEDWFLEINGRSMTIGHEDDNLEMVAVYRLSGVDVVPSDEILSAILTLVKGGASKTGLREVLRPLFTTSAFIFA